ncbi:hypothetical protein FRC08_018944 [Ceratobasidium sp. 394]|nr:hypothetical protein FRC08_018944 [Ceratobasidium sp. 394]
MSQVVSNDPSMDIHPNAFQRWKSARTMLTHAINDYLAASLGLCSTLYSPACHPSSRHLPEQTLSEINLELSSLQSEEDKLRRMRATLANQRNQSRTLAPIRGLPSEILATIFSISSSRQTRYNHNAFLRALRVSPTALAAVCTSWRQVALESPSLWAYVDLVVGNGVDLRPSMQTTLWVERSRNVPLNVSIRDHHPDGGIVTQWHVERLIEFLAPLMHRVCALDVSTNLERNGMLSSVMESWIKNGSTNVEKTLQITNRFKGFSDRASYFLFEPQSDVGATNAFFRTINRLFLRNCGIPQHIEFHAGLVELHLEGDVLCRWPTQQEFVAMLAACPRLRVLALCNYCIKFLGETPSPVALNHLQSLSLETDDPAYSLPFVFPLLLVGSDALTMSLTLEDSSRLIVEARTFFDRTKVAKLCVRDRQYRLSLTALLSLPIPYLETLAIENFNISERAWEDIFGSKSNGCGTVSWPRLRTLYLIDSLIDASCLRKLVLLHPSVTKLHIYRPRPVGKHDVLMTDEECTHLENSMDMVEDYCVDFGLGNGPIDTWDFGILED